MIKLCEFLILSTLIGLLAPSHEAYAADKGSQFGIVWGLSVPDADNTNPFHLFGVKGEEFILPNFSLGGYYLNSDKSGQLSSAQEFSYSLTGIEAGYHIPATNGDTFISFRMGVTKLQENPTGIGVTYSPYHYGIVSGYDYYITSMFSFGFEGSYIHVLPGRTLVNSAEYDQPSFDIISFLITLQFRL